MEEHKLGKAHKIRKKTGIAKKIKKLKKGVDFLEVFIYNSICVKRKHKNKSAYGVWLSLARAPGLGPGGRRFESCHPDDAGVVQW